MIIAEAEEAVEVEVATEVVIVQTTVVMLKEADIMVATKVVMIKNNLTNHTLEEVAIIKEKTFIEEEEDITITIKVVTVKATVVTAVATLVIAVATVASAEVMAVNVEATVEVTAVVMIHSNKKEDTKLEEVEVVINLAEATEEEVAKLPNKIKIYE